MSVHEECLRALDFLRLGYAAPVPCLIQLDQARQVRCEHSLRVLTNKRHVFKATSEEGVVLVKLISDARRARKECEREAAGLQKLKSSGISAPGVVAVELDDSRTFGSSQCLMQSVVLCLSSW